MANYSRKDERTLPAVQVQERAAPVAVRTVSGCASWFEDLHKYK